MTCSLRPCRSRLRPLYAEPLWRTASLEQHVRQLGSLLPYRPGAMRQGLVEL